MSNMVVGPDLTPDWPSGYDEEMDEQWLEARDTALQELNRQLRMGLGFPPRRGKGLALRHLQLLNMHQNPFWYCEPIEYWQAAEMDATEQQDDRVAFCEFFGRPVIERKVRLTQKSIRLLESWRRMGIRFSAHYLPAVTLQAGTVFPKINSFTNLFPPGLVQSREHKKSLLRLPGKILLVERPRSWAKNEYGTFERDTLGELIAGLRRNGTLPYSLPDWKNMPLDVRYGCSAYVIEKQIIPSLFGDDSGVRLLSLGEVVYLFFSNQLTDNSDSWLRDKITVREQLVWVGRYVGNETMCIAQPSDDASRSFRLAAELDVAGIILVGE